MGVDQRVDRVKQLEEKHIDIICNIYPGLSTLWGVENDNFTDITKRGSEYAVKSLTNILNECYELDDIDYLKNNIEMRIFEFTTLRNKLLTAYYFYDMTIDTLLILWDDFVIYKYGLKLSVLENRLRNIIPAIDTVIKEMKQRKFSYLDLACTEVAIKKSLILLDKKKKEYEHFSGLFGKVELKVKDFMEFISRLKKIQQMLIYYLLMVQKLCCNIFR